MHARCFSLAIAVVIVLLVSPDVTKSQFSDAIEDNSFFIEEAYNQEPRVVQHILNGLYFGSPSRDFLLSFTQEWPVGSQDHQLSLTVPYFSLNGNIASGVGDILVNYRYQLHTGDDWAAVSPRLSVVLPTGSSAKGLGMGVVGVQFNLPVSRRLTEYLVAHLNAGGTVLPSVKGVDAAGVEVRRTLTFWNVGGSIIVLTSARLNLMMEVSGNFFSEVGTNGNVVRGTETVVSPGLRYAVDVGQLQIVPGVAVPVLLGDGANRTGAFMYLSFEHPF
jgi:hypothetical protein